MNWIPRDGMLRPLASVRPNPPELVSDLIDSSACWDRQKLLQFFYPTDVEVISNIPLSTRRQGDFWAWHYKEKRDIHGTVGLSNDRE
jgi:hypothetical protein